MGITFDDEHAPGLGRHHAGDRACGQGQGEMPVRQGPRGRTQRLLRGAQVRIERRPESGSRPTSSANCSGSIVTR